MAQEWNRVALAVARKMGQTVGLNASTRIAMAPKPVAQFRIQFFGVPTDRAPTILGEVDPLALDALAAIRQSAHAAWPPRAIGFCLIDRRPRSFLTAEGRSLVGIMHDALAAWSPAARVGLATVSAHNCATGKLKSARRSKSVVAETSSQCSFLM
jgi:hypothetical protein